MMNDWYERSMKALQLAGLAERTQYTYTREVRLLVEFCGKTPDLIAQQELEEYFLHRRNVTKWSSASLRVCYSGIRFFYEKILQRDWNIFGYLRAERTRKLPAVLSQEEITRIFSCVRSPHYRAFLFTVYSCGLRLQEALFLEVGDIDRKPPPDLPRCWAWAPQSRHSPPPHGQIQCADSDEGRRAAGRNHQAIRAYPLPAPFVCHPPSGGGSQPARDPALSRPFKDRDHHDVPPSDQKRA